MPPEQEKQPPNPLPAAVPHIMGKERKPTGWTDAEWQAVSAQLRLQSVWVACEMQAESLRAFQTCSAALASGRLSPSDCRRAVRQMLHKAGYQCEEGQEGTFRDLSQSVGRQKLILETNAKLAAGYTMLQDLKGDDAFPALRLVRTGTRRNPRDWQNRWREAYAACGGDGAHPTEMVARTDSPIWPKLSRFGYPWPPFDYNSGMTVQPVPVEEARALGLSTTANPAKEMDLIEGKELNTQGISPQDRAALQSWLHNFLA